MADHHRRRPGAWLARGRGVAFLSSTFSTFAFMPADRCRCQHTASVDPMGSLSIRRLDDDVIRRLRERAASHGISMEEEARRILGEAVSAPDRVGDLALTLFGPVHGHELGPADHPAHEPIDLTGER